MCRAVGELKHYLANDRTKSFGEELLRSDGIPADLLLLVKSTAQRGAWRWTCNAGAGETGSVQGQLPNPPPGALGSAGNSPTGSSRINQFEPAAGKDYAVRFPKTGSKECGVDSTVRQRGEAFKFDFPKTGNQVGHG